MKPVLSLCLFEITLCLFSVILYLHLLLYQLVILCGGELQLAVNDALHDVFYAADVDSPRTQPQRRSYVCFIAGPALSSTGDGEP